MTDINNPPIYTNSIVNYSTSEDFYNTYIDTYQYIESLIAGLENVDPQAYLEKREQLLALEGKSNPPDLNSLQSLYEQVSQGKISAEEFKQKIDTLKQQAIDIVGGNPAGGIKEQISTDYAQAQQEIANLLDYLEVYQENLNQLGTQIEDWQASIASLEAEINALSDDDPRKALAQQSLTSAKSQLEQLTLQQRQAQAVFSVFSQAIEKESQNLSVFEQLLARIELTPEDIETSKELLQSIQNLQQFQDEFSEVLPTQVELNTLISALQEIQNVLNEDPNRKSIQANQKQAQQVVDALTQQMNQNQAQVDSLNKQIIGWEEKINGLQTLINQMTDPTQKAQAEQELAKAKSLVASLKAASEQASSDLSSLTNSLSQAQAHLQSIQDLAQQVSPTMEDAKSAENHLTQVNDLQNQSQTIQTSFQDHLPSVSEIEQVTGVLLNLERSLQPPLAEGMSTYFDMGVLGSNIWGFISWKQVSEDVGYSEFNSEAFTVYLKELFANMQQGGMNQINLSFIQLSNLEAYLSGDFSKATSSDVIAQQLKQFADAGIRFPEGDNLLSLISSVAHESGMKVNISCGGEQAAAGDFALSNSGAAQAAKMAEFMSKYGIDSIDFDIEGSTAAAFAQEQGVIEFFKTLHTLLAGEGKTISLTIQGSLVQTVWGTARRGSDPSDFNGPLKGLFYDENNQPLALFDDLNLMMYDSGTSYYLDAKPNPDNTLQPDWCIEDWLDVIGPENAEQLHIGFQDATAYQNSGSSASGHQYDIDPSSSSGAAAAEIYRQLQEELRKDGYTTTLGEPFWWPNVDGNRYTSGDQFVSQVMKDFYDALEKMEVTQQLQLDVEAELKQQHLGYLQG